MGGHRVTLPIRPIAARGQAPRGCKRVRGLPCTGVHGLRRGSCSAVVQFPPSGTQKASVRSLPSQKHSAQPGTAISVRFERRRRLITALRRSEHQRPPAMDAQGAAEGDSPRKVMVQVVRLLRSIAPPRSRRGPPGQQVPHAASRAARPPVRLISAGPDTPPGCAARCGGQRRWTTAGCRIALDPSKAGAALTELPLAHLCRRSRSWRVLSQVRKTPRQPVSADRLQALAVKPGAARPAHRPSHRQPCSRRVPRMRSALQELPCRRAGVVPGTQNNAHLSPAASSCVWAPPAAKSFCGCQSGKAGRVVNAPSRQRPPPPPTSPPPLQAAQGGASPAPTLPVCSAVIRT
jgi:hypothetical protein